MAGREEKGRKKTKAWAPQLRKPDQLQQDPGLEELPHWVDGQVPKSGSDRQTIRLTSRPEFETDRQTAQVRHAKL
jgi:hypothetical protein